jgi:hypothetical protein
MWKGELGSHKSREEKVRAFERRLLRRIYGSTCDNGVWRIKYNDKLYGLHKDLDIVRLIKVSRLRWLGHLARKKENSPCKEEDKLLAAWRLSEKAKTQFKVA